MLTDFSLDGGSSLDGEHSVADSLATVSAASESYTSTLPAVDQCEKQKLSPLNIDQVLADGLESFASESGFFQMLVDEINRRDEASVSQHEPLPCGFDLNADGMLTPVGDVLRVVNSLNRFSSIAAEAKGESYQSLPRHSAIGTDSLVVLPINEVFHTRPDATRVVRLIYEVPQPFDVVFNQGGVPTTVGVMSSFDRDGDPDVIVQAEWNRILYLTACVAEKYAPFDVDFTNDATVASDYIAFFGGHSLTGTPRGIARIGGPDGYTFGNERDISSLDQRDAEFPDYVNMEVWCGVVAHELGHNLGLYHQGLTSEANRTNYIDGTLLGSARSTEYDPGTRAYSPIMGSSLSSDSPLIFYDDQLHLFHGLDSFQVIRQSMPLREDDFPDSKEMGTALEIVADRFKIDGLINRVSDRDVFAFNVPHGQQHEFAVRLSRVVELRGSLYDAALELYDSNGLVLSTTSVELFNELELTSLLPAGNYYLEVVGGKSPGAVGAYFLEGTLRENPSPKLTIVFDNEHFNPGDSIDLGDIKRNEAVLKNLGLQNVGGQPVTIRSVDVSDFPRGIDALFEVHNVTLQAGESIELPLRIQLDQMDPNLGGQFVINTDQERVEVQIGAAIYESVRWKNLTHVEVDASGNLTKVAGSEWDAGGSSSQVLAAGADGWVEIVIDQVDKNLSFGLSQFDATGSYTDFEYAVALNERFSVTDSNGHFEHAPKMEFHSRSREGFIDFSKDRSTRDGRVSRLNALGLSQAFQPNLQDYHIGDVIRIEREGNQVLVKRNGFVVMAWSADPNQELSMDTSLFDVEAQLSEARLSFNLAPQLIEMRPSDKAERTSLSVIPTLFFDESVQLGHGQVEIVNASDDEVVQVIEAKDLLLDGLHHTRVLISLDSKLNSDTEYYVNVDRNSITDQHGVPFAGIGPHAWSFTTGIAAVHQNPSNRNDVNGDGMVTPFDVLVAINLLNAGQFPDGKLPEFDDVIRGAIKTFADVNGDGFLSPNDVIRVVNDLNRPR